MGIFPTDGCLIQATQFSDTQKDIINQVVKGKAFVNPTKNATTGLSASINGASGAVNGAGTPAVFAGITGALATLTSNLVSYISHSDRLSGASLTASGPSAEPGINGLVGTARTYNSICESLTGGIEDNFSPLFNSILGPGNAKLNSISQDIDNKVTNFVNIHASRSSGDSQFNTERDAHIAIINTAASTVLSMVTKDNNAYHAANDAVMKYSAGNILLDSQNDPCFTGRLIEKIASKSVKEKIEGLQ